MAEHVGQHGGTMSFSRPRLAGTGMIRTTLRLTVATVALGALAVLAGVATSARADSKGPIDFESYTLGNIDTQQGWSKTGPYDVEVANVADFPAASTYGFGTKALRISDQFASGSFGDQTFAPALTQPAGEATPQRFFNASFQIGTTQAGQQCVGCVTTDDPPVANPLHLSVSPDNGSGGRMSYLRFEDQGDGVHVFFDDVTDSGPYYRLAAFSDNDIATLSRATAHAIDFSIQFIPGPGNDVVNVTIDGVLKATGTTWEDYYRYDNENQGTRTPPTTSTLLFKEGGSANAADAGQGFLVDNLSYASTSCMQTGFVRDGIDLTAAQIGGSVTGTLDASGCNIGAYNPTSVTSADISGANYYGVVVNDRTTNVAGSSIHNIGEVPFNGTQHGNAVLYINGAHGTISGSTVTSYQKNGITVSGKAANGVDPGPTGSLKTSVSVLNNTLTGNGHINYIAQNGIQISFGATAIVRSDTVSANWYTPSGVTACGVLLFKASGVTTKMNSLFDNETNLCNAGRGGGQYKP
jgi:hypothetical protein